MDSCLAGLIGEREFLGPSEQLSRSHEPFPPSVEYPVLCSIVDLTRGSHVVLTICGATGAVRYSSSDAIDLRCLIRQCCSLGLTPHRHHLHHRWPRYSLLDSTFPPPRCSSRGEPLPPLNVPQKKRTVPQQKGNVPQQKRERSSAEAATLSSDLVFLLARYINMDPLI